MTNITVSERAARQALQEAWDDANTLPPIIFDDSEAEYLCRQIIAAIRPALEAEIREECAAVKGETQIQADHVLVGIRCGANIDDAATELAKQVRNQAFGKPVDRHCPYDEGQLFEDMDLPGHHICRCCYTTFKAVGEQVDEPQKGIVSRIAAAIRQKGQP